MCAEDVYIYSFVTKSNQALNIHPNVFYSFCWTITHGEYHRMIYKQILLLMVTPIFPHLNLPTKIRVNAISAAHHPPSIRQDKSMRHMNTVINNNFLSFNSPQFSTSQNTTGRIYWSPQTRFLIAGSNFFYKVIKFSPWVILNVNRTTISPIIMEHRTSGLTHLLGRQGKHMWLIVRQLPIKTKVKCSPCILGFSRSNLHVCQNLILMSMFGCHCQLVTVDWRHCWICMVVFRHLIMVSKKYA